MDKIDLASGAFKYENPNHIIFSNKELAKYLGVCCKTLQKWRDQGIISYSKIGRELFYTMKNVQKMLDDHRFPSRRA